MKKSTYYPLGLSQSTVNMQSMFSKHKEVLNINLAFTPKENWDYECFEKAFNKEIERNDCLRIKFKSGFLSLKQTFLNEFEADITILDFSGKTEKEQQDCFQEIAQTPLKLTKGQSFRVFFCKTFDNKTTIYLSVSHLIFDIYGLVAFVEDLNKLYHSIKNNEELANEFSPYEDSVKSDVSYLKSEKFKKDREYFKNFYQSRPKPNYAGIHGIDCELWKKRKQKGKLMKMFLFNNKTESQLFELKKDYVDDILTLCENYKQSPSILVYSLLMTALSCINEKEENILALNLCNGRATIKDSKCGGTKAQSIPLYMNFSKEKTFVDVLSQVSSLEKELMRHFKFPELKRELIMHKSWHSNYSESYYPFTYSFIPTMNSEQYDLQLYSSNRFVLSSYVATFFDIESKQMKMMYMCQTAIINKQNVLKFHETFEKVLKFITQNPACKIEEIYKEILGE